MLRVLPPINDQTCLAANQVVASCVIASHADVLRGSSRVPAPLFVGQERVTNPLERLRGRLVA